MSPSGPPSTFSGSARKRDLWWQFAARAVQARYRGSFLGILWAVLNPILMLGIYYVVFGLIFRGYFRDPKVETTPDYAMTMFLGLSLYLLVADTLGSAPLILLGNVNLVKKVVFPLEILPVAQAAGLWFNLAISLTLALGGAAIFGSGVSIGGLAFLPVILAPLLMLTAGLSWLLSALGVFFRDLAQLMPFISQIVLYSSAVFFPLSRIPVSVWHILKWNPFLETVVLSREVVLWGMPVNWPRLAYTYAVGVAFLVIGRWVFYRLRPAFADVI